MSDPGGGGNRLPLVIGSTVVLVAAIIAIAVGVNGATNAVPTPVAGATPPSTPVTTATPIPTPTPAPLAFADCSTATFGPALQPLNPPTTVHTYSAAPALTIDTTKLYQATMTTSKGAIVICLQPMLAPNTVNVFVTLVRNHFYDGIPFHRVCPSAADTSCGGSLAIIQGGDPNCINNVASTTCGQGGPGFQFADEPVNQRYGAGTIAMANSGANTNGSQFFICTGDDTSLPPSYNLFGNIESGATVASSIAKGDVMTTVTVRAQQ